MTHMLDRYSMGYDSDVWCDVCRVTVPVVLKKDGETLGDLVRAVTAHEIERHHVGSPV